jgi:hypothetical protein
MYASYTRKLLHGKQTFRDATLKNAIVLRKENVERNSRSCRHNFAKYGNFYSDLVDF